MHEQREVVPVDTHVYQIAVKHYGMRGSEKGNGKVTMSPKIYDEVNARLAKIWGNYAGWAQSVCLELLYFTHRFHPCYRSSSLQISNHSPHMAFPKSLILLVPSISLRRKQFLHHLPVVSEKSR